ncbi:MAG TPA: alkaline phosphatase family protein [Kofleriaceae bacterium]
MSPSRNVFAPVVTAILLVILGGAMALSAWRASDGYRPALNQDTPALERVPPILTADHRARLSRRVVIVIIDGLRLKSSYGQDLLDQLRREGVDAVALSHYPSYSRPNHVAILTGVPPAWSGVRNNAYGWPVMLDSIMDRANSAGLRSAYAADRAFGAGMMFHDDFEAVHYAPWPRGFAKAAKLVVAEDYPLVVLLPGAVDEAGHAFGARSEAYAAATAQVDRELGAALAALDLAKDTVIVTADHGHTDPGGHGGLEKEVLEVPLILAGAGIRPGAPVGEAHVTDVAPTAAALLGVPAPGHALGRTLVEALDIDAAARASLIAADQERLARNQGVVDRAKAEAEPEIAHTRRIRLAIVAGLFALAFALLLAGRRFGALHVDWRVLVIAVPAFPLTYYALLDIVGQNVSLSALPDRDDALNELFQFGLVSTGVQVVAGWIALRGRVVLRDRMAAANALTACGMLTAWVSAGIMWALFSPGTFVEPPGSTVLVLVPATYIAAACHALAVAVTLGLEIVVFFARAVDPRVRLRRLERAAQRERRRIARESSDALGRTDLP